MKENLRRAKDLALAVLGPFFRLNMPVFAGCATLFLLTASFPLLIWVLVLVNHLPGYSTADVAELLGQFLPQVPEIQDTLLDALNGLSAQSTTFVASFAAVTTLFSASSGMAAVQKGLQRLTPGARFRLYDRLLAIVYTIVFVGLLLAVLLLQGLRSFFRPLYQLLIANPRWADLADLARSLIVMSDLVVIPVLFVLILLMYTFVPGGRRPLRGQVPGAVFATAGWLLFSRLFSFYIAHFWRLSYIYGSLTAIILMILWLDIIINLLFLGAALNAALPHGGPPKSRPASHRAIRFNWKFKK
ncbi:MAG: YihY/virulence factor BrkB family protein [Blautia massiliensis (ex Durand et al. 2017)]